MNYDREYAVEILQNLVRRGLIDKESDAYLEVLEFLDNTARVDNESWDPFQGADVESALAKENEGRDITDATDPNSSETWLLIVVGLCVGYVLLQVIRSL
jgi:hypothetical protein